MKKRKLLWLATIILSSIFLIINSCKKDEKLTEEELITIQEQEILNKIDDFAPNEIINLFESHFNNTRHETDYASYLDSIDNSINELRTAIQANFSLSDYDETLKQSLSHLQNLKSSKSIDDCFGLGYVKGVEIDVGASGTVGVGITAGLQAAGGGGVETVYDFVNMDRQVYYHTFCSYGYNFGAGATAALSASVGFSGVNSILTGIRYHGNSSGVDKFEGPSLSTSHSLSGGIAAFFGIDFSIGIGMSNSAYADLSGIGNLLPCPNNMVVLENGVQGYSFQVSGSLSAGAQAELALAYSNNSVGTNSYGSAQSYKKFSNRRPLAGLMMATEIVFAGPLPGITSNLQGYDMVASTIALIYGFKNFSSCPGELPTIGTFHVGNITFNSATSGGIVINESGSPISDRGVVWSAFENPTIFNNQGITIDGSGIGEFTSNISGLNPNTTYYVRAYATNGAGTTYGQQFEFKTLSEGGQTVGNLYFLSDESGNNNIYLGELSGNQIVNIQQITEYSGNNQVFAYDVCKNTGRIAYAATQDGHRGDIYILETISSNPVLLPNQPSSRVGPLVKWSPDGNSLLFSIGNNRHYHHLQTATMNLDGSNYQLIINTNQPMGRACHKNTILWLDEGMYLGVTPQWAAHATDHDLWFRNPEGTFTKLTNTSGIGERHVFMNQTASTIIFNTIDNSGRFGIRHMPKTGGTQSVIIPHSNNHICWPNGWLDESTIIYTYRPNSSGTKYDLYLIDLDGNNARNISNNPNSNITNAIVR